MSFIKVFFLILIYSNTLVVASYLNRNLNLQNGHYRVTWQPLVEGKHTLNVKLKELPIRDCPKIITVRQTRNYYNIQMPIYT